MQFPHLALICMHPFWCSVCVLEGLASEFSFPYYICAATFVSTIAMQGGGRKGGGGGREGADGEGGSFDIRQWLRGLADSLGKTGR